MKKLKKSISLFLAFIMIMSCCSLFSSAQGNRAENTDYPFILVHGLGGWGQYDAITESYPYWGAGAGMSEGDGNFVEFLGENGYEACAVSV